MKVRLVIIITFLLLSRLAKSQNLWEYIPDFKGGSASQLLSSPEGTIYVLGYRHLRSFDFGKTWEEFYAPIWHMTVGPDGVLWGSKNTGLFRSTDKGDSWTNVISQYVKCESVDIKGNIYCLNNNEDIIFKSSDKGKSWTQTTAGLIDSAYQLFSTGKNLIAATRKENYKIKYSSDNGITWHTSSTPVSSPYVLSFISGSEDIIFAVIREYGIIYSSNGGTNWEATGSPPVSSLIISKSGALFAAGEYIYKSTNNGFSWDSSLINIHTYQTDQIIIGVNEQVYVSANGDGIFNSTDNGHTWQQLDYLNNSVQIGNDHKRNFFVDSKTSSSSLVNTLYRSSNNGIKWDICDARGNFIILDNGIIIVNEAFNIARSSDSGVSWKKNNLGDIFHGFAGKYNGIIIVSIEFLHRPGGYPGWIGLKRSTDSGITWTSYQGTLPAITESSPSGEFFGSWDSTLLHSATGEQWHSVKTNISGSIKEISFNQSGMFLIATSSGIYAPEFITGYDSALSRRILDLPVNSLCIASTGEIFATTSTEVICSRDTGKTWENISQNLPRTGIRSITVDQSGNALVSTYMGLYRSLGPLTGVPQIKENISESFILLQNYPNPFNPFTTISYNLSHTSHVSLTIFDILGQELETLINTTQEPGLNTYKFDASALPSGIYIYQLKSGNYLASKKMLVIK